jgi:hypothetical protein
MDGELMDTTAVRLYNQRMLESRFTRPAQVVTWLGAVQAQDYNGAGWALGLRSAGLHADDVDRALAEGTIVRTHVLRPTWHLVGREDVRWLLTLTGPRVHAVNRRRYVELGLDRATARRFQKVIHKALAGGNCLTRNELATIADQDGIDTTGQRLPYLLIQAELDQVIGSGELKGKQHTYALFDERVPAGETASRKQLLARLAKRYFTSRGPAKLADFVWWSGLLTADAREAVELAADDLVTVEINGEVHWMNYAETGAANVGQADFLLPAYDELLIGYRDRTAFLSESNAKRVASANGLLSSLMLDGQVRGIWRRTLHKHQVVIEAQPFEPLASVQYDKLVAAAEAYGRFLGLRAELNVSE